MTPDEIIEKGIENIQQYGHIKGAFGDTDQGFCALGSMRQAAFTSVAAEAIAWSENKNPYFEACTRVAATITNTDRRFSGASGLNGGDVVPHFNDDHGTTAEDVMLMMKRSLDT